MKKIRACELCHSNDQDFLFEKNGYKIVRCRNCQLVFVANQPTEKKLRSYYTRNYFINGEAKFGYFDYEKEGENCQENFIDKLKKVENYKKAGRLLDVGCAYGMFLKNCGSNWLTSGVEISSHAVNFARKKLGLDIFCGTLLNAPWQDGEFDVITMWDVLDHMANALANLLKANKLLKKGGLLVFNVGDIDSFLARLTSKRWYLMIPPTHLYFFSRKTILKMLKKSGFQILKI
ncbi:class I SAM-dependent methyltransferase, partial [Candidatus Gottesmanbacteria bacterium]|nr:class I SAM-dependent methyltransferase [Candidatus Gottesmanbacteria bacterium]